MSHFKLGNQSQAIAYLTQLKQLMKLDEFKIDEDCKILFAEAIELIESRAEKEK